MAEVEPKPKAPETAVDAIGECEVDAQQAPASQRHDPQQRQALGAWWAAYKAERHGASTCPVEPGVQEEQGDWTQQLMLTEASFIDLIDAATLVALGWYDKAKGEEPPPAWREVLEVAIGLIAGATLGGLASQATANLLDLAGAATDLVVGAAIRTGMNAVEGTLRITVASAIDEAAGDKHAALRAFCLAQAESMQVAAIAARKDLIERAGTFTHQRLTISALHAIQVTNEEMRRYAQALQGREMLIGWTSLLAGDTSSKPPGGDIEDIDQHGVLRIDIAGQESRATRIVSARIEGLNPQLRASLSHQAFGRVRPGRRAAGERVSSRQPHGLDLVMSAAPGAFNTSQETRDALAEAGFPGARRLGPLRLRFSVFVDRSGLRWWVDDDLDWQLEGPSGADASRYFLHHLRTPIELLKDLDEVLLPKVES